MGEGDSLVGDFVVEGFGLCVWFGVFESEHAWISGREVYAYYELVEFSYGGEDGASLSLSFGGYAHDDGGVLGEEALAESEALFVGFVHGN